MKERLTDFIILLTIALIGLSQVDYIIKETNRVYNLKPTEGEQKKVQVYMGGEQKAPQVKTFK